MSRDSHELFVAGTILIPSVMLAYHPKCELHASLGMDDFTLRTDSLLVEDLVDRVDELSAGSEPYRQRLTEHIADLRKRVQAEFEAIHSAVDTHSRAAAWPVAGAAEQ